jgi:hypothetical protein
LNLKNSNVKRHLLSFIVSINVLQSTLVFLCVYVYTYAHTSRKGQFKNHLGAWTFQKLSKYRTFSQKVWLTV